MSANEGMLIGMNFANQRAAREADKNAGAWKERSDKFEAENRILRNEVNLLDESDLYFTCSIAGVRGVTRELLEELRKSDPKNPLLDKKTRDRVFDSISENVWSKVKDKSFKDRDPASKALRDSAYGSEGSSKSGPEKSKITPNLIVRAEAEVPSHISDREKLLGLVERLTAEVKKNNPNAEILKDKVMLEIFSEHPLDQFTQNSGHPLT